MVQKAQTLTIFTQMNSIEDLTGISPEFYNGFFRFFVVVEEEEKKWEVVDEN